MKGLFKKFSVCFLAILAVFGFVACQPKTPATPDTPDVPAGPTEEELAAQLVSEKAKALKALDDLIGKVDTSKFTESDHAFLTSLKSYGVMFIEGATTVDTVKDNLAFISAYITENAIPSANGAYGYVAVSYEKRTEILGILEKYAVENFLTGISLFENSNFVMYDPSVKLGTETYIPGYGFGALTEGEITADLANEPKAEWKRYYHSFETEDPKKINYGDDKGSVVGGIVGYIHDSYWGTKMNETKDGYEWYNVLAKTKPMVVEPIMYEGKDTGLAKKYKFEIKVGSDLVYSTLSDKPAFAKFDGTEAKAEDYLTMYKIVHTQEYGWARAAEDIEGAGAIKGMANYYAKSKVAGSAEAEAAWKNVGLRTYVEDGKTYLEVEFVQPCNSFYAMYYLSSSIYTPVPMEFVEAVGVAYYGKFDTDRGLTPVDTTLATGPYVLEAWEADKQIVFKKNDNYKAEPGMYKIAGVHLNILSAANEDAEAGLKEFLAGNIHASGIPSTRLSEFKSDPRTKQTTGDSVFKLNVNTCNAAEWESLFGENGTITRTTKEKYWEVEPALSVPEFVLGISYSINRVQFAEEKGATASVNYFSSNYMSDPENGVSYNSTDAHKNAINDLIAGTDGYGYSVEKARAYFRVACQKLLASGAYKEGDTITLEVAWQRTTQIDLYHKPITQYWLDAFNHESVCGGKLTLAVKDWVGASWSDVYYKKMMVGQYDIGFGSISGNSLNPLNFMEVLKSDNSSGFTLNWGPDTSKVDANLVYDGVKWSYDSLWQAAETGGYFLDGLYESVFKPKSTGAVVNEDGSLTLEFDAGIVEVDGVAVEVTSAVVFDYCLVEEEATYKEDAVDFSVAEGKIIVTVSKELYDFWLANSLGYFAVDIYYTQTTLGVPSDSLITVDLSSAAWDVAFPEPAE